ncbi:hypothetical protein [Longimicrobium sp.]|uniref:hypothetical protein n=1 Tax=Longimicrobium sp. TaxID=2029185 RepID=UPI002E334CB2|nr:hypothetical protein [Longimicrobium sp.]HEX6037662.1 hypothetical protein [Longimicrobium sp.]
MTDDPRPWNPVVATIQRLLDADPRLLHVDVKGGAVELNVEMGSCWVTVDDARGWEPATDEHARALAERVAAELAECREEEHWRDACLFLP